MEKHLNIEDLYDYSLQVIAILNAMIDWSNGKENPVDEETQKLDVVQDLLTQVKALDDKLRKLS